MVTYANRNVVWRTVATKRKQGVTEQLQATVSFTEDGVRRRKTKLFPADAKLATETQRNRAARKWLKELDAAEAERIERERLNAESRAEAERQAAAAELMASDPYATMTVGEYASSVVEGLAAAGDIERSTAKSYRGAVRHIKQGFPNVLLRDLKPAQVQAWRDSLLADGYASSSVTKFMRVLSEVMRQGVNMEILDKNPVSAVRAPKRKPPEPNSLTSEDYAKLAYTLAALEPSPVVTAAAIALHCGLRCGEICGIRWREYDSDARIIHVCEAIGNSGSGQDYVKRPKTVTSVRDVPVPAMLAKMLDRRRAAMVAELQETGVTLEESEFGKLYVCGSAVSGKFASPTIIERQFKALAESFGIRGSRGRRMTMHGLRDSYATLAIMAGGDVRSVASALGHANPSITLQTYADALPSAKRRTSDLLESIVTTQEVRPYAELAEAD